MSAHKNTTNGFITKDDFRPKPTLQSWLVIFTASLFLVYQFLLVSLFDAIAPALMKTFNIDGIKLADLSSYYFLSCVIFLFIAGFVIERFSVRNAMLITMPIAILSTFLFSLTTSFDLACIYRFFMGVANAFALLGIIKLIINWLPPKKTAFLIGVIFSIAMLGNLISQEPFGYFVATLDWRIAMQITATLGLIFFILIAMFVRDFPKSQSHIYEYEKNLVRDTPISTTFKMTYGSFRNWICGLSIGLISLPVSLLGSLWGVVLLVNIHHMTLLQASDITSVLFIGMIISAPISGWISDKLQMRRIPLAVGTLAALIVSIILLNLSAPSYTALITIFFLLGFFTGVQILGYPLIVENNSPLITTLALSVVSIAIQAGSGLFQILFGYLVDDHIILRTHTLTASITGVDFHWALWIFPLALLIATALIPFLSKNK